MTEFGVFGEPVAAMLAREADEAEARAEAEERGEVPPLPGHRARPADESPPETTGSAGQSQTDPPA